ncbi:hypothetical protein EC991_009112 [Linnemannia zychae]|nr:hypothetical protein EC991_009112 [Linnemannia zychae]
MTVFGDSYSDTGNGYSLSNNTWPPSWYYNGRFSNGKAWPEHVSEKKHYKLQNYAFGGATSDAKLVQGYSGADTTLEVPGFIQQVQNYKNDHLHRRHGVPVLDELFVINFQGNDFEFDRSVNPHMVVDRLKAGLETLIQDAGARRILVLENLNYGLLPYYNFNATLAEIFSTTSHKQRVEYRHFEASLRTKYGPEKYVRYPSDSCGSKDKNSADQVHVAYLNMADLYKDLYRPDSLKRLGISDVVHGCTP